MTDERTVFLVPEKPQGREGPPFVHVFDSREEAEQHAESIGSFVSPATTTMPVVAS